MIDVACVAVGECRGQFAGFALSAAGSEFGIRVNDDPFVVDARREPGFDLQPTYARLQALR